MRILVTLFLGLYLAGDLCHGQRSSRRGRGMGRDRRRQFSCTDCREESMHDPYVCQNCYKEDSDEPFKCRTPGRQQIINTITKLGPAIEASLGWGTVQNNIKFHIGDINNPNFTVYLNNIKQKSKYSSKIYRRSYFKSV